MTKQEYYDLLVKSAHDGTFPGYEGGGCVYRTDDGRKCAVGVILPDSVYTPDMEENSIGEVFTACCDGHFEWVPKGMSLGDLSVVQNVHDKHAEVTWDAKVFVENLNELDIFEDVVKV